MPRYENGISACLRSKNLWVRLPLGVPMSDDYEDLKRARYSLLVDAEIALCNGLSKEEWKCSSYVKSTRDKIWWIENQDINYIAEYIWENYKDYFE